MKIKYFCIEGREHHPEMDELTVEQVVQTVMSLWPMETCELYLDDEKDEVPNIGLIFGHNGYYQGYGLGGDDDLSVFVKDEIDDFEGCLIPANTLTLILTNVMARF